MSHYIIVETESGLQVAGVAADETPDDVAIRSKGVIVDPGPYNTYEDAYDAMLLIPDSENERAEFRA